MLLTRGFRATSPRDDHPTLCRCNMQNGTVKSNEELVKVLNAAEVPGTDVVGESCQQHSGGNPPSETTEAAELLHCAQRFGQHSEPNFVL